MVKTLYQCFRNVFVRGTLLTSKKVSLVNKECPDDRYPKLKIYISERILNS